MQLPENLKSIQRVNVVGTSGSGKSTFSKRLAQIIDAPHVEIDKIFWQPNWTNINDEQLLKNLEDALSAEKWVLDGNYHRTIPVKWKNVDVVIWLDYSLATIMSRITRRSLMRVFTGVELWEGTSNRETLFKLFGKDSIVLWAWNTFRSNRIKYSNEMNDARNAHIRFVRLASPGEAERFLEMVKGEK